QRRWDSSPGPIVRRRDVGDFFRHGGGGASNTFACEKVATIIPPPLRATSGGPSCFSLPRRAAGYPMEGTSHAAPLAKRIAPVRRDLRMCLMILTLTIGLLIIFVGPNDRQTIGPERQLHPAQAAPILPSESPVILVGSPQ